MTAGTAQVGVEVPSLLATDPEAEPTGRTHQTMMGVQREERRVSYNLITVFVAFEQPFVVHTHYLSFARTFTLAGDVTARCIRS